MDQRRADARLCLFFKILHGLVAVPLPDYIQHSTRISRYCHSMTFRQVSTSTDYYKYSFFPLAIVQWNALPQSVACLQSLEVLRPQSARCSILALRSPYACFYLFLAILNYFNLSSVFILNYHAFYSLLYFNFFCLILTDAAPTCLECPRGRVTVYRERKERKKLIIISYKTNCRLIYRSNCKVIISRECSLFIVASLRKSPPGMDETAYLQQNPRCVSLLTKLSSLARHCRQKYLITSR